MAAGGAVLAALLFFCCYLKLREIWAARPRGEGKQTAEDGFESEGSRPPQGRLGRHFVCFWTMLVVAEMSYVLSRSIYTDVAAAWLNGGTDPCVGGGRESAACLETMDRFAWFQTVYNSVGTVITCLSCP